MKNKNRSSSGFTLIEIMVVLIIIAIMASFIVPSVISRPDEARATKVKNDIMGVIDKGIRIIFDYCIRILQILISSINQYYPHLI